MCVVKEKLSDRFTVWAAGIPVAVPALPETAGTDHFDQGTNRRDHTIRIHVDKNAVVLRPEEPRRRSQYGHK